MGSLFVSCKYDKSEKINNNNPKTKVENDIVECLITIDEIIEELNEALIQNYDNIINANNTNTNINANTNITNYKKQKKSKDYVNDIDDVETDNDTDDDNINHSISSKQRNGKSSLKFKKTDKLYKNIRPIAAAPDQPAAPTGNMKGLAASSDAIKYLLKKLKVSVPST